MSKRVEGYYNENVNKECEQLEKHRTEFTHALHTLEEYLPPKPAPFEHQLHDGEKN